MKRFLFYLLSLWVAIAFSQTMSCLNVNNVKLNGICLNDSLFKCLEMIGMPTDIIMNDAWPAGENISPALDRYRYGTTEIYSNSNDSGGAYFSGFRIEDNIYHFIVTLYDERKKKYELCVGCHLNAEIFKKNIPGFKCLLATSQRYYYSIPLCGNGVEENKNFYLNIECDGNNVIKLIEVDYGRE